MQDIIDNSYIGPFRVSTIYYFLDAPISGYLLETIKVTKYEV